MTYFWNFNKIKTILSKYFSFTPLEIAAQKGKWLKSNFAPPPTYMPYALQLQLPFIPVDITLVSVSFALLSNSDQWSICCIYVHNNFPIIFNSFNVIVTLCTNLGKVEVKGLYIILYFKYICLNVLCVFDYSFLAILRIICVIRSFFMLKVALF